MGDGAEHLAMIDAPCRTPRSDGAFRRSSSRSRRLATVVLMGTVLGLAACSSTSPPSISTLPPASSTTSGAGSGSASIAIQNFSFSPSALTVAPGATVTVTNRDQVAHTVTATGGVFRTGDIPPGQSTSFTAPKTPGTYDYICSIHQYMTGTLTVSG